MIRGRLSELFDPEFVRQLCTVISTLIVAVVTGELSAGLAL